MSKTYAFLSLKCSCVRVEIFLNLTPEKNQDEMVEVNRQFRDFFMNQGESFFEIFSLTNTGNVREFTKLYLEMFF